MDRYETEYRRSFWDYRKPYGICGKQDQSEGKEELKPSAISRKFFRRSGLKPRAAAKKTKNVIQKFVASDPNQKELVGKAIIYAPKTAMMTESEIESKK